LLRKLTGPGLVVIRSFAKEKGCLFKQPFSFVSIISLSAHKLAALTS
jgi:hypothetical protein